MTRINCGIKPLELSRQHLLAELREIKRIPNNISSGKFNLNNRPSKFTLGRGHVKFFYDKLAYLHIRYNLLRFEAINRGYNVSDFDEAFMTAIKLYPELCNDYKETPEDRAILIERLKEKDPNFYSSL